MQWEMVKCFYLWIDVLIIFFFDEYFNETYFTPLIEFFFLGLRLGAGYRLNYHHCGFLLLSMVKIRSSHPLVWSCK